MAICGQIHFLSQTRGTSSYNYFYLQQISIKANVEIKMAKTTFGIL
jgi:hypothetical protein